MNDERCRLKRKTGRTSDQPAKWQRDQLRSMAVKTQTNSPCAPIETHKVARKVKFQLVTSQNQIVRYPQDKESRTSAERSRVLGVWRRWGWGSRWGMVWIVARPRSNTISIRKKFDAKLSTFHRILQLLTLQNIFWFLSDIIFINHVAERQGGNHNRWGCESDHDSSATVPWRHATWWRSKSYRFVTKNGSLLVTSNLTQNHIEIILCC